MAKPVFVVCEADEMVYSSCDKGGSTGQLAKFGKVTGAGKIGSRALLLNWLFPPFESHDFIFDNRHVSSLSCKFEFGIPAVALWSIAKHVATFVVHLSADTSVFTCCNVEDIKLLTTPSGACHVVGSEYNVLQMFTLRTEDHYTM